MKISICFPQYNRIEFLLKSLDIISRQTYDNIEIAISDDCSSDNTEEEILKLKNNYRYPIVFHRFEKNQGFDRNTRKSIELGTGDYCFVIGNDDSVYDENSIQHLVDFLTSNNYPAIGFCNFVEYKNPGVVVGRAKETIVIGSGNDVALKYYSCFGFVGGLIFKKSVFDQFNTSKHDGSVYVQMYLAMIIISAGYNLFSIKEPLVLKDFGVDGKFHSYKDRLTKKWKNFKKTDGGLFSVIRVLFSGLEDSGVTDKKKYYFLMRRIYCLTMSFWILDYKSVSFISAIEIFSGLHPSLNPNMAQLTWFQRLKIFGYYYFFGFMAIITPYTLFKVVQNRLYTFFKN